MTKIKICGLKSLEDIAIVNQYLPDYIGFVFAKSPRRIGLLEARQYKYSLDEKIKAVGVFVNEEIGHIENLCHQGIIDIVQLHGDEDEEYILQLRQVIDKEIIKAIRVRTGEQLMKEWQLPGDYLLLDTYDKESYGGSGTSFNHELIPTLDKKIFLAGGMNKENVIAAIRQISPYAIDISSGVEVNGRKDEEKIKEIIELIRNVKL